MSPCTSQPISWLRLEQLALGELRAGEAAEVEHHIANCPACRACLEHIRASEPSLSPLRITPVAPRWSRWLRWSAPGALLAAAALILWLTIDRPAANPALPGPRVAVKGGELAINLIREHRGATADPSRFRDGDRFLVEVTCPPGRRYVDVVVAQGAEVGFPIPAESIDCGNRVSLASGFRITGNLAVTVCAILGDDTPPDRNRWQSPLSHRTGTGAACRVIDPAAP